MEIRLTNLKFLGLGLPMFLFSCASMQQISDDEVYKMRTPDLPMDANLLDETSYETYKFRRDKKIESKSYYNERERQNTLNTGVRPLLLGSPYFSIGSQLIFCNKFYGAGYYYHYTPMQSDPFSRNLPRATLVGFSAGTNLGKSNIITTPNNQNVYGTNPVYIKPNSNVNKPSFKPEGRSEGYASSKPNQGGVVPQHRSNPSSVGRTTPTTKPSSSGTISAPRSTSPAPKAGGRKF